MFRGAIVGLALLAAVAGTGCSGGGSAEQARPAEAGGGAERTTSDTPLFGASGPLRGVYTASEVPGEPGLPTPRLGFPAGNGPVTAVIVLGADTPARASLTITWYRRRVEGRQKVAESEIETKGGPGYAVSRARVRPQLSPGLYEVEARLGGHRVRSAWVVMAEATDPATPGSSSQAATGGTTLEDWEVDTGTYPDWGEPEPTPSPPRPPGPCEPYNIFAGLDPMTDLTVSAFALGLCKSLSVAVAVAGPPRVIGRQEGDPVGHVHGNTDICQLPGGSDLPGTVVTIEVAGTDGARKVEKYTLEDHGEALVTGIDAQPEPGSRVKPGDRISLHALALLMPPALGIKELSLDDGTTVIARTGNLSGSSEPASCDPRRLVASILADYRVPNQPPLVLRFCAVAVGFDGTSRRECIEFFTGDAWSGEAQVTTTAVWPAGIGTCRDAWKLAFSFAVSEDGRVEGTGAAERTARAACPFPIPGEQWESVRYRLSGTKDADGFHLRFAMDSFEPPASVEYGGFVAVFGYPNQPDGGPPVTVAITGNSAHAPVEWSTQSGSPPVVFTTSGALEATCTSCAR